MESKIRDRQSEYYRCIQKATDENDTSTFIDFMLEAIRDALVKMVNENNSGYEQKILQLIADGDYTNASEVADRLGVSEKTVRRAISSLKEKRLIERDGSDKNGIWIIRK